MKRDVGIGYATMRKIHYNVTEVLAGRYKSVSGRYYVMHDPQKLTDKYITAWSNFGIDIPHVTAV